VAIQVNRPEWHQGRLRMFLRTYIHVCPFPATRADREVQRSDTLTQSPS
jgi:aspartyl/asparaginyl beta-hydroxylase (cupin superfamily)